MIWKSVRKWRKSRRKKLTRHGEDADKQANRATGKHDLFFRIISLFLFPARPDSNAQNKQIK